MNKSIVTLVSIVTIAVLVWLSQQQPPATESIVEKAVETTKDVAQDIAKDVVAEVPEPVKEAVADAKEPPPKEEAKTPEKPELPQGIISNPLIADAPLATDHVMGAKDAPVVLVEYASLSCPHCGHFAKSILPDLQKKYIDTGKLRYVLRQFPLNDPAFKGAMLVTCMGEESSEKYYLFNKVLFDSQDKWAFDGDWQNALEKIAAVGGVGKEKFDSCLNSKDREEAILLAKQAAMKELKIPHTPYLFIGGEAYNGEKTIEEISKFIDAKLAKK